MSTMILLNQLLFLYFIFSNTIHIISAESTETNLANLVHNTLVKTARECMEKVNATEKDIEGLRKDDPPYPEKASCIVKCLCEKVGVVRNNKFSKAGFLTAVTPLIFANKKKLQHMKSVADKCETEINHHHVDPCQLGNEITTCLFKYAPELHFKERSNR